MVDHNGKVVPVKRRQMHGKTEFANNSKLLNYGSSFDNEFNTKHTSTDADFMYGFNAAVSAYDNLTLLQRIFKKKLGKTTACPLGTTNITEWNGK